MNLWRSFQTKKRKKPKKFSVAKHALSSLSCIKKKGFTIACKRWRRLDISKFKILNSCQSVLDVFPI
jgi:hypothetical protein